MLGSLLATLPGTAGPSPPQHSACSHEHLFICNLDRRTFTTSYAGTLQARDSSSGSAAAAADGPAAQQAAAPAWEASGEQIPRGPLTARDPILLYDELALYESELDDHGSSRLSVKVRAAWRSWGGS